MSLGCASKGAEMPNYQNLNPPIALASGDVGFSFNNEAFPGSAQAGTPFAWLSYLGTPDRGATWRGQLIYGSARAAVSLVLQAAMADIDAEYQTIDTAAGTTTREARTVTGVQAQFLRIKFLSATGGAGVTAEV